MRLRRKPEKRMSLGSHLRELRNRLFWSAIFLVSAAILGWFLFDPVFNLLQEPILDAAENSKVPVVVNFGTVVSAFDLRVQVSIFLGVIISSPVWLYNLWAFVSPGLKTKERRYTLGFLLSAIPLFLAGTALAWYALPGFVTVLISFTPSGSSNVINASEYVLFAIRILLIFGLAFVMPVVLVLLNFSGLLSARSILRSWRLAVFVIAVVSALATPVADVVSMFLLMLPLTALYFSAYGIAYLHDKRASRKLESLEGEANDGDFQ